MDYDAIGRLLTSTTDGTQPVEQRVVSCAVGNCVLRRQTFQAGAPIKTRVRRPARTRDRDGVEGFDGKEVVTTVDFNARGAKIAEHQPISTGVAAGSWNGTLASPYMTQYAGIDALGRVTTKTVVRTSAADFFEPGRGSANLVTDLQLRSRAGRHQDIHHGSHAHRRDGQITMSRTYDPRGNCRTVQDVTSPTAHSITTAYAYDPAGIC